MGSSLPQNTKGLGREDVWGTGFGARMLDEVEYRTGQQALH